MGKFVTIGKILLLLAFFAGLFLLARNAQVIRKTIANQFGMTKGRVAGARTSLEKEMKKDVSVYLNEAKNQALDVRVSDIIKPILRARKIGEDVVNAKEYIVEQAESIMKR